MFWAAYWRFAVERQQIFYRRALGQPWPWTDDPVLGAYKFTNAYRASDRVSQFLIRNVIYREDLPGDAQETVFRSLLFKLFNKIETWHLLERSLGPISAERDGITISPPPTRPDLFLGGLYRAELSAEPSSDKLSVWVAWNEQMDTRICRWSSGDGFLNSR